MTDYGFARGAADTAGEGYASADCESLENTAVRTEPQAQSQSLAAIFPTYSRSYAFFDPSQVKQNGLKVQTPNAETVRGAVTLDEWMRHIAGEIVLGVVPVTDDDGVTTTWGGGDVDEYGISIVKLLDQIERLQLPLVVYKTKSNGARYLLTTTEPVPVSLMRGAVETCGRKLGLDPATLEIFPKQERLDGRDAQGRQKLGTVLWMPYSGDRYWAVSTRIGRNVGGYRMPLAEFVEAVEKHRVTPARLRELAAPKPRADTTPDKGASYAAHRLDRYASELADAVHNRNDMLTAHAFHLGQMIARGWIDREPVETKLWEACNANGLTKPIEQGGDGEGKTRDTLTRQIEAGMQKPHDDLVEGGSGRGRPSHAQILGELAEAAHLFHAPDRSAFADVTVAGHRETWAVRSEGFKHWLTWRFYQETQGAPSKDALNAALGVIEARARYEGPEREVFRRVGGLDGRVYLDLCNDAWEAIEIDASGWQIVSGPPVRFRRAPGMLPLPHPVSGASIGLLRPFLNVPAKDDGTPDASDPDFVLTVAWLLATLRPGRPYPVLVLSGEQGTSKSVISRMARLLIDPNKAGLRALPRDDRDLFIAASNGYVLAFDNISNMPPWISDALCRLATGGGYATRQLYSDDEEKLFDAMRPIILNGIGDDVVSRSDLAERAIVLALEPIPEDRRRPEDELWTDFDEARPGILGALLDAVAHGLRKYPETRLDGYPRMADFARWAAACEGALWEKKGTFWAAYDRNRGGMVEKVLDLDPFAVAVRNFIDSSKKPEWVGTATALLEALNMRTEQDMRGRAWPAVNKVTTALTRIASDMRKVGYEIVCDRDTTNRSRITIRRDQPQSELTLPAKPREPAEPEPIEGRFDRTRPGFTL